MNFTKQIIDDMFKCYSVNALSIDGKTQLIYAGEGPGVCAVYSGKGFDEKKVLWDGEGGTMSLSVVDDMPGYFFASKGFFSMVDSDTSGIYLNRYVNGEFEETLIAKIPFLHRFDVITSNDKRYLVAASLHGGKVDKQDWSKPGKIYVAELPMDLSKEFEVTLEVLIEGLTQNHGFNKSVWGGREVVLIASQQGVHIITPPSSEGGWQTCRVIEHPVSDVAAIDIDGDGEMELALLSPFHGNQFNVYKNINGQYTSIFQYPEALDFYHAIFADTFNDVPSFVIGARKETMDLFLVQYDQTDNKVVTHLIDSEVGPSNARIIHTDQGDVIMSANRQINQAAIYK